MALSLLVKVGDVWVDPVKVIALEWYESKPSTSDTEGDVTWQTLGHDAHVAITLAGPSEACARGVTIGDAAAIINGALEALRDSP